MRVQFANLNTNAFLAPERELTSTGSARALRTAADWDNPLWWQWQIAFLPSSESEVDQRRAAMRRGLQL